MRFPVALTALALLCAPFTPSLAAQSTSAAPAHAVAQEPPCDGVYNIMRVSDLTPTGSVDKFMAATAAQQAWYSSHGFSDVIFAARVIVRDPQTHALSYSDKEFVTCHYGKPGGPQVVHDAAWDAFVKMYNETSTIKETFFQCVPAAGVPGGLK